MTTMSSEIEKELTDYIKRYETYSEEKVRDVVFEKVKLEKEDIYGDRKYTGVANIRFYGTCISRRLRFEANVKLVVIDTYRRYDSLYNCSFKTYYEEDERKPIAPPKEKTTYDSMTRIGLIHNIHEQIYHEHEIQDMIRQYIDEIQDLSAENRILKSQIQKLNKRIKEISKESE